MSRLPQEKEACMFPYSFPKLHHTVLEGPELSGELWSHVGLICINCEVCLKQNKGHVFILKIRSSCPVHELRSGKKMERRG